MKVRFKACLVSWHRKLRVFVTAVTKVEVVIKSRPSFAVLSSYFP